MKVRTKLVMLLSAALVITMITATWLRIRFTRQALESRAYDEAEATAAEIAEDLERNLKDDADDDDVGERLKYELRRHRTVANLEFTFDSDEDTTVSFKLDFTEEDPRIKHTPKPQPKPRPQSQRRDEARRALLDHGGSTRPPGERFIEPLWRTADKADSTRWSHLAPRPTLPARHRPKAFFVDQRNPEQKQSHRFLEVPVPFDPEGPRRGQITVRVSVEAIDRLIRTEEVVSAIVFGSAVLVLMVLAALIVDRVVGKPVEELERAMREVEKGDLSRRVVERRKDEIGALSRGFNAMIGRLSEATEEIQAFNRRLADEVKAATLDLARKNEALGQVNRLLVETRRELGDKERLAALGQMAAQLAHEMGTPLSSVSGHLQLALSSRDLPAAFKERLLVATRELERVSKIVRDYLDSTRPVAPARIRCDLGRVVEEAIGIVGGAQARAGLAIEHHVEEGLREVETDPGLVRQILVNLLTNAIDATASGGGRHIDVRLFTESTGDRIELSVTDDGVGVRPEDAARIFEPFYTTKGRGKGTGLGLSICRELTSALGGRLSVASNPGAGSTFTLALPQEWTLSGPIPTARPGPSSTGKMNVI